MTERQDNGESHAEKTGSYLRVARFDREENAGAAYQEAQALIFHLPCDLSVYRLQFEQAWHVAAVGLQPRQSLADQLEVIFSTGELAVLPPEVIEVLRERGARSRQKGPWSERHVRFVPPKE